MHDYRGDSKNDKLFLFLNKFPFVIENGKKCFIIKMTMMSVLF